MNKPLVEWGIAAVALPGEAKSGDRYLIKALPNGVFVAVVDGLGHGDEAAAAAKIAISTLEGSPDESIMSLVNRCHEGLRSTRGVAMSVALFKSVEETMTWLGVGNVEGMLLRADPTLSPQYESLLLRGGVVGGRLPLLHASIVHVMRGDTLVFVTDGIRSDFAERLTLWGQPQQMADRILVKYNQGTDDALVLVVRYLGGAP